MVLIVRKGVGGYGLGAAAALYFGSYSVPRGINTMSIHAIVAINGWLPTRRYSSNTNIAYDYFFTFF